MPIYVYKCECGNQFEEVRPISESGKTFVCKCGKEAKQIIVPAGYEPWRPFYCGTQNRYFATRDEYTSYCRKKGLTDGITAGELKYEKEEARHMADELHKRRREEIMKSA